MHASVTPGAAPSNINTSSPPEQQPSGSFASCLAFLLAAHSLSSPHRLHVPSIVLSGILVLASLFIVGSIMWRIAHAVISGLALGAGSGILATAQSIPCNGIDNCTSPVSSHGCYYQNLDLNTDLPSSSQTRPTPQLSTRMLWPAPSLVSSRLLSIHHHGWTVLAIGMPPTPRLKLLSAN